MVSHRPAGKDGSARPRLFNDRPLLVTAKIGPRLAGQSVRAMSGRCQVSTGVQNTSTARHLMQRPARKILDFPCFRSSQIAPSGARRNSKSCDPLWVRGFESLPLRPVPVPCVPRWLTGRRSDTSPARAAGWSSGRPAGANAPGDAHVMPGTGQGLSC
jgi:hypothetical protein